MSVLTPVITSWDGENRRAYLAQGVSDYYPIEDIYHEYRNARRLDYELRKYAPLLKAEGNIKKGGGAFTPRYVVLLDGFKIVPYNETLQVNQLGDMITDDPDTDATLYDVSGLTVAKPIFIKPSNAETVQLNSESIVFSSFQGAVWVDVINGYSDKGSATEPNGNTERPVANISLAVEIAVERGFNTIQVIGSYDLGSGDNVSNYHVVGTSHTNSLLTVAPEALALATRYESFDITGTLDGGSEVFNCVVKDLDYFNGYIRYSVFDGRIVLSGNADAMFDDCKHLDINNPPIIDAGGSGQNLIMTEYAGRVIIDNLTGPSKIGIGLETGEVIINSTCTAGVINVSGTGSVIDNSGPGCLVVDKTVDGTEIKNLRRIVEQLRPHHTGTGNIWFYDPVNGNDLWDGKAQERAFKTFAKAHDAVVDNNHDIIFLVPGNTTGETITDEDFHVTKNYVLVRGPGRDFVTTGLITTTGAGTEFSGFRVNNTDPLVTGVHSTGAFTLLENLWFEFCTNGALMTAHHPLIHSCKFHGMNGYAVKMEGDISHGEIYDCTMGDAGETTIQINTTAGHGGIKMRDTVVVGSAGYGVELSATTRKFIILSGNVVQFNALGEFNDLGTDNVTSDGALTEEQHDALMLTKYLNKTIYVDTEVLDNGDGTQNSPFKLVSDAKDLVEATGIKNMFASGDIVVPGPLKSMNVYGIGLVNIDFNGQDIKKSEFHHCTLTGTYTDHIIASKCILADGMLLSGYFEHCELSANVTAAPGGQVFLTNCHGNKPGTPTTKLCMCELGASQVSLVHYSGDIIVTDADHIDDSMYIKMDGGTITIDDTCVAGEITIKGICHIIDNSAGTTIINDSIAPVTVPTKTDVIVASQL